MTKPGFCWIGWVFLLGNVQKVEGHVGRKKGEDFGKYCSDHWGGWTGLDDGVNFFFDNGDSHLT
jgi:hypothetical protein